MKKNVIEERVVYKDAQWSTIATLFIKEAARCEGYASDVWYHLTTLRNTINIFNEDGTIEGKEEILVGFRDMGVDSNSFVKLYLGNNLIENEIASIYRKLYKVTVEKSNKRGYNRVTVTLSELYNK